MLRQAVLLFLINQQMKKIPTKPPIEVIPLISKKNPVEIQKLKAHIIGEIIEYVPNSVVIKSIIKKSTGNISLMAFDTGEGITERILAYDTFAQIIDGKAEITIEGVSLSITAGQSIIIPAHLKNTIKAKEKFKMMLTTIVSTQNPKRKL